MPLEQQGNMFNPGLETRVGEPPTVLPSLTRGISRPVYFQDNRRGGNVSDEHSDLSDKKYRQLESFLGVALQLVYSIGDLTRVLAEEYRSKGRPDEAAFFQRYADNLRRPANRSPDEKL